MKYKLVLFDFDGTLANTFPWLRTVLVEISEKYNLPIPNEEQEELFRTLSAKQIIQQSGVPLWKIPLIIRYTRKRMNESAGQVALFEGIQSLLKALSVAGVELGVVSTNSNVNIRKVLGEQASELIQYFEGNVSLFGKPSRIKKIIKSSGISPAEIIMIGDEIRDLEAARKTGIASGAVAWGFTRVEILEGLAPTEVFHSVDDISTSLL